jgi:hypothetical protein
MEVFVRANELADNISGLLPVAEVSKKEIDQT